VADYVLWRRLTETDFNAMNGLAAPSGGGGGAMHISLGVRSGIFPIDRFLDSGRKTTVDIETAPQSGAYGPSRLSFAANPGRRGGEWLIRDQFSHRHPAWSPSVGFPTEYANNNPPYILVFRIGHVFHVRFTTAKEIEASASIVPNPMLSAAKGIAPATTGLLRKFHIDSKSLLEAFEAQAVASPEEAFDPKDVEDGRRRVLAAVLRRQGQPAFRRALLKAYGSKCAMTNSRTPWVLEAAHITPYMGASTNTLPNGLLLRADIHTLFDLGLISIDPDKREIRVSKMLAGSGYSKLDGRKLTEPKVASSRPSAAALKEHFALFQP
jgi:hypothetical protein